MIKLPLKGTPERDLLDLDLLAEKGAFDGFKSVPRLFDAIISARRFLTAEPAAMKVYSLVQYGTRNELLLMEICRHGNPDVAWDFEYQVEQN